MLGSLDLINMVVGGEKRTDHLGYVLKIQAGRTVALRIDLIETDNTRMTLRLEDRRKLHRLL